MAGLITIHFVCTGNIYRSRLAEAYCNSRNAAGVRAFSSGVAAGRDGDALISPYAAEILTNQGILAFAAARWQRTTEDLVRSSAVLVFMEEEHHRFCGNWIEPTRQSVEVWGVRDIGDIEAAEIPGEVERTFANIRRQVDALMARPSLT